MNPVIQRIRQAPPNPHVLGDLGLHADQAQLVRTVGTGVVLLLLLVGIVRLLFGWRIFHRMFPLYIALLGMFLGAGLGLLAAAKAGLTLWVILPCAAAGAVAGWWVARPIERYVVMLVAAFDAAALAGAACRLFGLPVEVASAAGVIAFVAVAVFAYWHHRVVVVLGTSLEGALLIVLAAIGLPFLWEVPLPRLLRPLHSDPILVGLVTLTLAVAGVVCQFRAVHAAADAAVPRVLPPAAKADARRSAGTATRRKAA